MSAGAVDTPPPIYVMPTTIPTIKPTPMMPMQISSTLTAQNEVP